MINLYYKFIALYFFMYYSIGCFLPLISQYFRSSGFTGENLGIVFALGALFTIVMQPIWGILSDKYRKPKLFIYIIVSAYALSSLLIYSGDSIFKITIAYILYMVFFSGQGPVTDSIVVGSGLEFGRVRLWGSIGFAVGAQVTGLLAEYFGFGAMFISIALSSIIVLAITATIEVNSSSKSSESKITRGDIIKLLSNKNYLIFLLGSFFIGGTIGGHNSYFGLFYKELGGSISGIGLAFFLFAGSEAPIMAVMQRVSNKISIATGLLFSSLFFVLRWFLYSMIPSPQTILILFVLQGLSIGSFLVLVTLYINEITSPKLRTTAIAIYFSFSTGIGRMVIQYFSGIIIDEQGVSNLYSFYTFIAILGTLFFTYLVFNERRVLKLSNSSNINTNNSNK